ncbi:MAG TPA: metal ABC transporter permease [Chlamydiales bacterium]|nr:metal ABC transporter permease [Chlamydiales bacterium]
MNPFWGTNFFTFFQVLFSRLFTWNYSVITADEIQIGTLSCIAICCGLIGPFLVLKKMTMFANSLSHTILLGIVISFLLLGGVVLSDFSHLFVGALIAAIFTAILTEGLVKWFGLAEDASVGLVFTVLFAAGIVLSTLFLKDVHLGIESVIGNADVLQLADLRNAAILVLLNSLAIVLFFRQFRLSSFDSNLAKVLGIPEGVFRFSLLFLVSVTCMGAFRAVGVLLVLAFLVGPFLTARLFCHRLKQLLFYSCIVGIAASFCGVAFARHILSEYDLALSTGGIVVCLIGLFYFLGLIIKACLRRQSMILSILKMESHD